MSKKLIKFLGWFFSRRNIYLIITLIFIFWMFFLDTNSWLRQIELQKDINLLKSKKKFYSAKITSDKEHLKNLKNLDSLEKYARENFYMKRENEDIFIIEMDSVNYNSKAPQ